MRTLERAGTAGDAADYLRRPRWGLRATDGEELLRRPNVERPLAGGCRRGWHCGQLDSRLDDVVDDDLIVVRVTLEDHEVDGNERQPKEEALSLIHI